MLDKSPVMCYNNYSEREVIKMDVRAMLSYKFKNEIIDIRNIKFVKKVDDKMLFISCYDNTTKEKIYDTKEQRDKVFEQYKNFVKILKNT